MLDGWRRAASCRFYGRVCGGAREEEELGAANGKLIPSSAIFSIHQSWRPPHDEKYAFCAEEA